MKLKRYAAALAPICLVTFVFRILELILSIDPRSGHFVSGTVLPTVFNLVLVAVAVFFMTLLFGKREPKPAVARLCRQSLFDLIVGIAGSVFLITAGFNRLLSEILGRDFSLNSRIFLSGAFWQMILSVLAALFIIFFVTYPKRTAKNNGWKILSLALTAYHLFMLLDRFQDLDVVFSHAFGIYEITYYGMATLASVNFSKTLSRLFGRKSFSFCTCMMAVLATLRLADTVLYLIPDNPYSVSGNLLLFCADGLLTLLYLSQMNKLRKGKKRRTPPKETEAPAEPSEQPTETVI